MKKLFSGLAAIMLCMTLFAPSVFASGISAPVMDMAACHEDQITGTGMVDADFEGQDSAACMNTDTNKTYFNDARLYGLVLTDDRPMRMYEAAVGLKWSDGRDKLATYENPV